MWSPLSSRPTWRHTPLSPGYLSRRSTGSSSLWARCPMPALSPPTRWWCATLAIAWTWSSARSTVVALSPRTSMPTPLPTGPSAASSSWTGAPPASATSCPPLSLVATWLRWPGLSASSPTPLPSLRPGQARPQVQPGIRQVSLHLLVLLGEKVLWDQGGHSCAWEGLQEVGLDERDEYFLCSQSDPINQKCRVYRSCLFSMTELSMLQKNQCYYW